MANFFFSFPVVIGSLIYLTQGHKHTRTWGGAQRRDGSIPSNLLQWSSNFLFDHLNTLHTVFEKQVLESLLFYTEGVLPPEYLSKIMLQ